MWTDFVQVAFILLLVFCFSSSSAFPHLTNHNEGAGNRSKVFPSRNSGKHQEVSILSTKKPPAFREIFPLQLCTIYWGCLPFLGVKR
jgi:hypothetical protein